MFLFIVFFLGSIFLFCIYSLPSPLLLLVVLHCSSPCVVVYCGASFSLYIVAIVYCGALPSPYIVVVFLLWFIILCLMLLLFVMVRCHSFNIITASCGSLSFIFHYYLCGLSPLALHCYLLWCVVMHRALLLFVAVYHPHLALLLFFVTVCCPFCTSTIKDTENHKNKG
jgi:hypothetical protein